MAEAASPISAPGLHTAVDPTAEPEPCELFHDLSMLVVEGRTPGGPRGLHEGPHCVLVYPSRATRHDCDHTQLLCQREARLRRFMRMRWRHSEPICVEVLLGSECVHGGARAGSLEPSVEPGDVLLEQWLVHVEGGTSCPPGRCNGSTCCFSRCSSSSSTSFVPSPLPPSGLLRAVHSHLHFSQLSAWLTLSRGQQPRHVIYRFSAPRGADVPAADRGADDLSEFHRFPPALLARHGCTVHVTVRSLARRQIIPRALCSVCDFSSSSSLSLSMSSVSSCSSSLSSCSSSPLLRARDCCGEDEPPLDGVEVTTEGAGSADLGADGAYQDPLWESSTSRVSASSSNCFGEEYLRRAVIKSRLTLSATATSGSTSGSRTGGASDLPVDSQPISCSQTVGECARPAAAANVRMPLHSVSQNSSFVTTGESIRNGNRGTFNSASCHQLPQSDGNGASPAQTNSHTPSTTCPRLSCYVSNGGRSHLRGNGHRVRMLSQCPADNVTCNDSISSRHQHSRETAVFSDSPSMSAVISPLADGDAMCRSTRPMSYADIGSSSSSRSGFSSSMSCDGLSSSTTNQICPITVLSNRSEDGHETCYEMSTREDEPNHLTSLNHLQADPTLRCSLMNTSDNGEGSVTPTSQTSSRDNSIPPSVRLRRGQHMISPLGTPPSVASPASDSLQLVNMVRRALNFSPPLPYGASSVEARAPGTDVNATTSVRRLMLERRRQRHLASSCENYHCSPTKAAKTVDAPVAAENNDCTCEKKQERCALAPPASTLLKRILGQDETIADAREHKPKMCRRIDSVSAVCRDSLTNVVVFNQRTSLPLCSSPAPQRRGNTFGFDQSLIKERTIGAALNGVSSSARTGPVGAICPLCHEHQKGGSSSCYHPSSCSSRRCRQLSGSSVAAALLGNFEESMLNGRLGAVTTVNGFRAELGASGSFHPPHLKLAVTVSFYSLADSEKTASPYLGVVSLPGKGYHVPRRGTLQVTLFNPHGTVVKMFVVVYDLSSMPADSRTFLRQRTLYMPVGASQHHPDAHKWLRYLIHLRFATGRTGRLYVHTNVRMIVYRKSDLDTASLHTNNDNTAGCAEANNNNIMENGGSSVAHELRSFVHMPENPRFSPR